MDKAITDATFEEEITKHKGVAVIDFWAPWCGPCQMMGPVIEKLADDMKDKAKIVKMNVDENQNTPQKFGIMGIPTMVIFKNGQEVDRLVGLQPKDEIVSKINQHVAE